MEIKVKKGWDDITISQYMALMDLDKAEYPELIDKGIAMVDIVYDIDARNISYTDFNLLLDTLKFLGTNPPKRKARASYVVNGVKYGLDMNYSNFTTSQFIDFTTYKKENDYVGMLSVVLIPEGFELYGDGYDLEKVKNDLEYMSVADAFSIVNFFVTASTRFIQLILSYLRRKLKRNPMPREQKKLITSQMKELETLMESSLMF